MLVKARTDHKGTWTEQIMNTHIHTCSYGKIVWQSVIYFILCLNSGRFAEQCGPGLAFWKCYINGKQHHNSKAINLKEI